MKRRIHTLLGLFAAMCCVSTMSAVTVPTEVQMPGTQPLEVGTLESPNKCDNCHGGYNSGVEPAHNWRGSMMAQAGRDPIFWATLAVAEQDFDGAGDLCIRCHSTGGWLAGRSTPTDGSGLAAGDSDGVECDFCHKLTNPDDSEHLGNQFQPFVAHGGGSPAEGYYGSGMASLWGGADKLGPYSDAEARHQFMQSNFHRDPRLCGSCHDVSNPVTGDLAPGHGTQAGMDGAVISSEDFNGGVPEIGGPVEHKAAFNNPPHAYGVVERTFSEFLSGGISQTLVRDYPNAVGDNFPLGGVLEAVWNAATAGGTRSADYENPPADRYFTCQSCHLRPVTGEGANKRGVPVRNDLPLHDMTGGNYWMPSAIDYLDQLGKLRLGGGMTELQRAAMLDGAGRAREQLRLAASVETAMEEDGRLEVRVINHAGHKLITGYPEGRRMWLHVQWFDAAGLAIEAAEAGAYGNRDVTLRGTPMTVRTLLNPGSTKVFEAHMGITQAWAERLVSLGWPADMALMYDPVNGDVEYTLGQLALAPGGTAWDSFHFALNNAVVKDNRIPPWNYSYDEARRRNALPVPADQYGSPGPGGRYDHYAEVHFDVPPGAESATVRLMYQPTSWEYVQFLVLANDGGNAFLADEGENLLEAWLATGMAEPEVMAEATWGGSTGVCDLEAPSITDAVAADKQVTVNWIAAAEVDGYSLYYDQSGKLQWLSDVTCALGDCSHTDSGLTNGVTYCYALTARSGTCESAASAVKCATPQPPGQLQLVGVSELETGRWTKSGKGKAATFTWEGTTTFVQGDTVTVRGRILAADGTAVEGAMFSLSISGPEAHSSSSAASDAAGWAEASWSTQRPNRKGAGGTAAGSYSLTVDGVSSGGYDWDGVRTSTQVSIQ